MLCQGEVDSMLWLSQCDPCLPSSWLFAAVFADSLIRKRSTAVHAETERGVREHLVCATNTRECSLITRCTVVDGRWRRPALHCVFSCSFIRSFDDIFTSYRSFRQAALTNLPYRLKLYLHLNSIFSQSLLLYVRRMRSLGLDLIIRVP